MIELRDKQAVAIDFETYYDSKSEYSLTKLSPAQYVKHPKFDPYLIAICGDDIFDKSRPRHLDTYYAIEKLVDSEAEVQVYVGRPERFNSWDKLNNRILLAHNAGFDQVVFERCMEMKRIPELEGTEWNCTADLTAYMGVNRSLKDAMKYLYDKEISKAVRSAMDGKHDFDLNEQELADLIRYGGDDAIECLSVWRDHCHLWPEIERAISRQNREAIMRGFHVDREYAEMALKCLCNVRDKAAVDIPWTTKINPKTKEFYPAGSLVALRNAVIELGIDPPKSFKKDDPGFLDWAKEHGDIPFVKARTRLAGTIQHIARIETLLKSTDEEGDIVHPGLIYFGAHTGRFSAGLSDDSKGAKNINMLNLPRANLFKGDPEVLDGEGIDMRGMYIPRPGYKFVIFDYSQIEARFSLWMAKEEAMMEAMKREGNLYQATSVHLGWSDPGDKIKKTNPDKYRLAKCCVTGDTLVLVRGVKKNGELTKPYYKCIIDVKLTDRVWDGHEWVQHLGVEKMKEVNSDELIEVGGVRLTRDHRVYTGETKSRRADEILEGREETSAVAWGESNCPIRGWAYVWALTSCLSRITARVFSLGARQALHFLASSLRLHRVRGRSNTALEQREEWEDNTVRIVCSEGSSQTTTSEHMGENPR